MRPLSFFIKLASVLGLLGVALGAFGAHGLAETLKMHGTVETWKTASHYHLIHAMVLLVLGIVGGEETLAKFSRWSFTGGILVFSGTLYVLSVTGIKWLGAITPIGGLLLMIGWLLLALRSWPRG